MPSIFTGPDNKKLGIRHNQVFVGNLPVAKGAFPPHVKDAVKDNPALENSFMALDKFAVHKPHRPAPAVKAPVSTGTPIRVRPGLQKK